MFPSELSPPARNRPELLDEFPMLIGAGNPQPRVLGECLDVLSTLHRFGTEVAPFVEPLDTTSAKSWDEALEKVLELACRHRVFSLAIPKSLGGSGCSILALSIGLEHLSRLCAGIANLIAAHGLALAVVGATGQLRVLRTLAQLIVEGERTGKAFLLATAATEPSAGSDLENFEALGRGQLQSHADRIDGDFALFGRKIYVSNGHIASAFIVLMPTSRTHARETLSAFLVYAGARGLSVTRVEEKLGQRACPAAELEFDNCRVSEQCRLNDTSVAGRTLDLVLGASRATVGAFGAGIARGVFETSRQLAGQMRSADGLTLAEHPRGQVILARMWNHATLARHAYVGAVQVQRRLGLVSLMESEPLRALDRLVPSRVTQGVLADKLLSWSGLDRGARRNLAHLNGKGVALASAYGSAAKICTSEFALENCELATELLGIEATLESTGLPKYWRDARLLKIYEGTNEICSLDVAQKLQDLLA